MSDTRYPVVVIVEDDEELASVYKQWLSSYYEIRTAHTAGDATRIIDNDVDVVLLDRKLPDTSGDRLLKWIQEQGYQARVAMLSGVAPDFDVIDMGFDTYVVKPITRKELHDLVDMLLTRTLYDQRVNRYLELLSKQQVLEQQKSDAELSENPEYHRLEHELADLRAQLDYLLRNLDDEYFAAELEAMASGSKSTN